MDFLIIDDDQVFRDAAGLLIEASGHQAEGARTSDDALLRLREDRFDAILLDLNLGPEDGLDVLSRLLEAQPQLPIVLITAAGSVATAVEAMRRGAVDFLEKPFTRDQFLAVLARLQRVSQLGRRIESLEAEVRDSRSRIPTPLFDFETPSMKVVWDILHRASKTPASVLILGESGTGKSIAARALHDLSPLADRPFITVSCPSLSRELLESELFGHVKGAFTGALRDHWGKVKAAEGGTLFLDEIGDLPLEIQPKLLRLLQERDYERLGENITRRAEVRVVAATNRDLKQRVRAGAFREDLFYRLNVIPVEMPPLRERQADLQRFANHYLQHFAAQCGRDIPALAPATLDCLLHHSWPGNLRELSNALERAVILARGPEIQPSDLPAEVRASAQSVATLESIAASSPPSPESPGSTPFNTGIPTLQDLEEAHIRRVLALTSHRAEAARLLGIDQATLYRKRKRMGLLS